MSEVARDLIENSFPGVTGDTANEITVAPIDLPAEGYDSSENQLSDTSTYTMASDQSQMSRDVDLWLRGTTETTSAQGSRGFSINRTTTLNVPSYTNFNGLWYVLALILPFFSGSSYQHWRCSPSVIFNAAESLFDHLARFFDKIRCSIRRLAQNQMSRELLATTMDIILFVYAAGFLILSLYQASVIG